VIKVHRTSIRLNPDRARVLIRPFWPFQEAQMRVVVGRIMSLSEKEVKTQLGIVNKSFAHRHFENIGGVFLERFERARRYMLTDEEPSKERKLLIGAYFTSEYSLESAALFNPSMIPHPDQSDLPEGSQRFIASLRAVGEGHVSSIEFREGIVDSDLDIEITEPGRFVIAPDPISTTRFEKKLFSHKVFEMGIENDYSAKLLLALPDPFTLRDIERGTSDLDQHEPRLSKSRQYTRDNMLWLAQSNYELEFSPDVPLSARNIFPHSPAESRGIEDARFVRFEEDDGTVTYYATYTAYSGRAILPQLLETRDFLHFKIITLSGKAIENKGFALFPRKIGDRYCTLSRQDGENVFIMYSDNIQTWREKSLLLRPTFPWEFIKLGNCGSPILTDEGWLVVIHGVGPMRKYCIGAVLLDRDDPSRVIGRLREPLLRPYENEREGYVPNVVYSCGSMVHNGMLILPYAMSDYASRIAMIDLRELLAELQSA